MLRRIARSVRLQLTHRVLTVGLGMVFTALVARQLGREAFGELNYVLSFWTMFTVIMAFGSGYPFVVEYVKTEEEERPLLIGSFLSLGLLSAALGFVACWVLASHSGMRPDRVFYVRLTSLALILGGLRTIQMEMHASERLQSISWLQLVQTAANLVFTAFLLSRGFGVGGVLGAGLMANLLVTLLTFREVGQRVRVRPRWSAPLCSRLARAGLPMMLSSVVLLLITRLDIFMLDALESTAAVGTYSAATRFLEMARMPTNIVLHTSFPAGIKAALESQEEAARLFYQVWRGLTLIAAPALFGLAVAGPSLIAFLFGPGFESSVLPLQLLAIHAWTSAFVTLCHQALMTDLRNWVLFTTSAASLVLNAGLNLLWIPTHGVAGAAAASVLSTLLLAALLHAYTRSRTGFTLGRIFHPEILRIVAAAALMGLCLWPIRTHSVFLVLPVAVACYLPALLLTGALRKEEVARLLGMGGSSEAGEA